MFKNIKNSSNLFIIFTENDTKIILNELIKITWYPKILILYFYFLNHKKLENLRNKILYSINSEKFNKNFLLLFSGYTTIHY